MTQMDTQYILDNTVDYDVFLTAEEQQIAIHSNDDAPRCPIIRAKGRISKRLGKVKKPI